MEVEGVIPVLFCYVLCVHTLTPVYKQQDDDDVCLETVAVFYTRKYSRSYTADRSIDRSVDVYVGTQRPF